MHRGTWKGHIFAKRGRHWLDFNKGRILETIKKPDFIYESIKDGSDVWLYYRKYHSLRNYHLNDPVLVVVVDTKKKIILTVYATLKVKKGTLVFKG